jgi:hypothetical protein
MRESVVAALAAVALIAGGVGWMAYLDRTPASLAALPRPDDEPLLVGEAPEPDGELPPLAPLPDLSRVDRRAAEPANLVRPRYCLLVFGPQAATRVWMVEDGDTLYVDRNANGDLTEPGEALSPAERQESRTVRESGAEVPYRQWTYLVGTLSPVDRSDEHTELKLVRYKTGDEPAAHVVSVLVNGRVLQYAGWGPLFADSRARAPVVHFGGPVLPRSLRHTTLRLGQERQELHFCVGTPGLGKHSFAYVGYEAVPRTIRPVVEIAWPTGVGTHEERFALARRC